MLGKTKQVKRLDPYAGLSKKDRKRIAGLVRMAKRNGTIPRSAPESIPFREMLRNGLCQLEETRYSRTFEFLDVNYRLAKPETKNAFFEAWRGVHNYIDPAVTVQFTYINQEVDAERGLTAIELPHKDDRLDELRDELAGFLREQLTRGNNGMTKRKFVTFSTEATADNAVQKLDRIEAEFSSLFKDLGSSTTRMNGYQRMELLHDIFNDGTGRRLNFNWNLIAERGITTRDFISPTGFDFRRKNVFELERRVGRVSYLELMTSELSDEFLSDILDMDSPLIATVHIKALDQTDALKMVKNLLTDLQKSKVEEQMKAAQRGYDMDILPPDLVSHIEDTEALLRSLQARDEQIFLGTVLLVNLADDEEELKARCETAANLARKAGCELYPLDWQQEAALMSAVPIGVNRVEIQRLHTTTSAAGFIPFMTRELTMPGGLYYGTNALSGNMILLDRLAAGNPNGLILGMPGSGKSFAAKTEIECVLLFTDDDILILDPEREYTALVRQLGGQVIRISADSVHHINPLDINLEASSDEDKEYNPIAAKSDFVLSFVEQVLGGRTGLEPIEKSILDRCVRHIYEPYIADPKPENMPTLATLYQCLLDQQLPEAQHIAMGLELYVTGSLNVFNNRTNVDIKNRLVCFDIKDLGKNLTKLGMLVTQDQVWQRVTVNRASKQITRYYVDEFHLLLREPETAAASIEMWKRFRKWGGVPTGITQNVSDFLRGHDIENIFKNSAFVCLLNQASDDRRFLAEKLNISEHQLSFVSNARPGEGLIILESAILPFVNHFPQDTKLYKLMTTKLDETITT